MLRDKIRIVWHIYITRNTIVILNTTFSRQTVIIPTNREKYGFTIHTLPPDHNVCVSVTHNMSNMQRTRHRRRWRIHNVCVFTRCVFVIRIHGVILPILHTSLLDIGKVQFIIQSLFIFVLEHILSLINQFSKKITIQNAISKAVYYDESRDDCDLQALNKKIFTYNAFLNTITT